MNGEPITVECANIAINYDSHPAVFAIMRDLNNSKFHKSLFIMQHSVSTNLVTNNSLENALAFTIKTICTTLNADLIRIWLLDSKLNLLNCTASWTSSVFLQQKGINDLIKPKSIDINEGIIGKVFHTNETHWQEEKIKTNKSGTLIVLPIKSDTTIGVMEIQISKSIPTNDFTLEALLQVSNLLGAYIKRKMYEKELIYLSNHDPVTGLISKYLFEQTLSSEIQLATNNDQKLALILLDINNFKLVNTTFNHASGDHLLRMVSERLLSLGFAIDHTSRVENDEFAIILHDAKNTAYITEQIIKINEVLSGKFQLLNESVEILVNIGVAIFPDDGSNVFELMRSADIALTMAKQTGSGAFQFSTLELTDNALQRLSMENSIRDALSNKEFSLVYQPIVDCRSMTTVGFEALLRWNHNGVSVPTEDFIPIVESTGLFVIICEWIIRTACQQCKAWQSKLSKPVYVSINLSMLEFQNPKLLSILEKSLRDYHLSSDSLTIEITEATLMYDKVSGMKIANLIKNLGIKFAIDDFGSGYSALNYLVHLPVDYIKLDKSFIDEICTDQRVAPIVQAAIELGKTLNYQTIAEGVETKEQLQKLQSLSCQYIQGFYFSKPMSASDTMKFIQQSDLNMGE